MRSTVRFIRDEENNEEVVPPATPFSEPAPTTRVGSMTADELAYVVSVALEHYHGKKAKGLPETPIDKGEHKNVITSVFGTAGNILHGAVDIAEGVVRGAVDVVTLGKARR